MARSPCGPQFNAARLREIGLRKDMDALFRQNLKRRFDVVETEDHDRMLADRLRHRVHVFHVHVGLLEEGQNAGQTAGGAADLNRRHIAVLAEDAVVAQHFAGLFSLVDQQTQNTEILRVRDGQRQNADVRVAKKLSHCLQTARTIFQKYRQLFHRHVTASSLLC